MSYLSASVHSEIIANPARVVDYYNQYWYQFGADLGPADVWRWMDNPLLAGVWCSMVANDLKPYGPERQNPGYDLSVMLNSPSLACDQFVALAWRFMELMPACAGLTVRAIGWDQSVEAYDPPCPVGNHAQMIVHDDVGTLLLDPTIGLVVPATYSDLAAGNAIDTTKCKIFCLQYQSDPVKTPFAHTVLNALSGQLYRPCHALYYFASLNAMATQTQEWLWPTPSAARFQVA